MRSNISTICNLPLQPQALAAVYYTDTDMTKQPTSQSWPYTDNGVCNNDDLSLTVPYYPITPNPKPEKTFIVVVDEIVNATGHLEWRLNEQAFRGNYNDPLLLKAQEKQQTYPPEANVVQPGNAQTVQLIVNNNSSISHVSQVPLSAFPHVGEARRNAAHTHPSQCISTATTCTSSTKAPVSTAGNHSSTPPTLSVATCKCCDRMATSWCNTMQTTQACGLSIVISHGIFRW